LLVTSDLIAEHAHFGERLQAALPDLAAATDVRNLALAGAPKLRAMVMLGARTPPGFVSEADFESAAGQVDQARVDALRVRVRLEQPAIMMYTSGTTANPKGCPLTHGALVRNGVNMNRERYFLSETDVFWAPLPMFHMAAILPFLACLDAGAAMSSMTHVEAGAALQMMERDRVTVAFPSFPTVTNDLISHPTFRTTDLSALRRINNVAPVEMLRRFQAAFPQAVQTGAYGLTEASGVISFNHPDESLEERLDACGVPFPGLEVRITDPDTLAEVPTDHRGELWVRGYAVFGGYHKSPEKNAESFHDGWFRTGDLCSVNARGAIRYHGRIKDMLKVGGENVAALEIESWLARHPAVQLAQVIGR
ncbi:MAG: fatty acid--CoA ligase family protein, partial [Pseudomonadales bacterium]